jgi:hypothetical protein
MRKVLVYAGIVRAIVAASFPAPGRGLQESTAASSLQRSGVSLGEFVSSGFGRMPVELGIEELTLLASFTASITRLLEREMPTDLQRLLLQHLPTVAIALAETGEDVGDCVPMDSLDNFLSKYSELCCRLHENSRRRMKKCRTIGRYYKDARCSGICVDDIRLGDTSLLSLDGVIEILEQRLKGRRNFVDC